MNDNINETPPRPSPLLKGRVREGLDKYFTGNKDEKIFDESDGELPDLAKVVAFEKEKLKEKYEKRKQIILKLKEFKMLSTLKNLVDFLLKFKNAITNIAGFIFALASFLREYLMSNEPNLWNVIMALAVWIIAYFTGKSPLK